MCQVCELDYAVLKVRRQRSQSRGFQDRCNSKSVIKGGKIKKEIVNGKLSGEKNGFEFCGGDVMLKSKVKRKGRDVLTCTARH